jgi:hypothetical protein
MLKFLKMMVAEDVITTEEVLVVVVVEEVLLQEEFYQEEKVQAVVEATETQVQRRWFGGRSSAPREVVWRKKFSSREKVLQTELQDVLKVLVTHLDQEDQEETNIVNFLIII